MSLLRFLKKDCNSTQHGHIYVLYGKFLFGYALLSVFFVLLSVWEIRAKTALIYFAELSFLFILIDKTEEAYEQLNL